MNRETAMDADEILLQKCKELVKVKLGWEESDSWTNYDFQALSTRIQDDTGVNLSVATLKRLWGKVKYDSKPTITTLNTLAQFVGFEDWRGFRQAHGGHNGKSNGTTQHLPQSVGEKTRPSKPRVAWRSGLIGTALCGGIVFILLYMIRQDSVGESAPIQYKFSSKKVVSEGIPNSVIFDYDATAAKTDCVFIQQSWDARLRTKVSRDNNQHTSIYYTPGFFQAKLVVDGEIVKEHDLYITSKDWIALVKQEPVPVYFKDEDFRKPGTLSLPIEKLRENNIPLQPELPVTSYYNVQDFGEIYTSNFTFESEVRSDYSEGAGVCQNTSILLLTDGNVIIIPLSIKGCISDLSLFFGGQGVDGKKADLSAFGCDLSQWVKVRCEVKDKQGKIFINDQLAYEAPFGASEKIVGLIYRFEGTGSVRGVALEGGDGVGWSAGL